MITIIDSNTYADEYGVKRTEGKGIKYIVPFTVLLPEECGATIMEYVASALRIEIGACLTDSMGKPSSLDGAIARLRLIDGVTWDSDDKILNVNLAKFAARKTVKDNTKGKQLAEFAGFLDGLRSFDVPVEAKIAAFRKKYPASTDDDETIAALFN